MQVSDDDGWQCVSLLRRMTEEEEQERPQSRTRTTTTMVMSGRWTRCRFDELREHAASADWSHRATSCRVASSRCAMMVSHDALYKHAASADWSHRAIPRHDAPCFVMLHRTRSTSTPRARTGHTASYRVTMRHVLSCCTGRALQARRERGLDRLGRLRRVVQPPRGAREVTSRHDASRHTGV